MAASSKAQLLNDIYTLLRKRYKLEPRAERLSVLEAVIYGICHEGATRGDAEQAMSRFREQFFDWNEVRVSSIEEIQEVLTGPPQAEERANRLRRFLRQLFEKKYAFDLDSLTKKSLKDSIKDLSEYEAMESDYVLASVVQQALGGHAMPVDASIQRGLVRLEVVDASADHHAIRSLLERAVPKNRGTEFIDLMEELTHDTCVAGPPDCPRCELRKICPTGQARQASDKASARSAARGKPVLAPAPPQAVKAPAAREKGSAPTPPRPTLASAAAPAVDPIKKGPGPITVKPAPTATPPTKGGKSKSK